MTHQPNSPDFWRPYDYEVREGPVDPECAIDLPNRKLWADGRGRLLGANALWYAYADLHEGQVVRARVAAVHHYQRRSEMPTDWGPLYSQMEDLAVGVLRKEAGVPDVSADESMGPNAGALIDGHIHTKFLPRPAGEWASGMGLGLMQREGNTLNAEYAALLAEIEGLADGSMSQEELTARLHNLAAQARTNRQASIARQPNHPQNR